MSPLARIRQKLRPRSGHKPGPEDVSTMERGAAFNARPNFYYFLGCGRPCWLPMYHKPQIIEGSAVTKAWPCEAYLPHDHRASDDTCFCEAPKDGDWVKVIGQIHGEELRNEIGQTSDIWDVVMVPWDKVAQLHSLMMEREEGRYFLAYASDLWLGNTGWHDIPYRWISEITS